MIETLREDHQQLRQQLYAIDSVLRVEASAWPLLHGFCAALSTKLEEHIDREALFLSHPGTHAGSGPFKEGLPDHRDVARDLKTILHHLAIGKDAVPWGTDAALSAVIEGLEQQFEKQERKLFPSLERLQKTRSLAPGPGDPGLNETVTVNRLVHLYPVSKRVFDRLGVDPSLEGSDELEEVAWRHGLDVYQLLESLHRAIRSNQ